MCLTTVFFFFGIQLVARNRFGFAFDDGGIVDRHYKDYLVQLFLSNWRS